MKLLRLITTALVALALTATILTTPAKAEPNRDTRAWSSSWKYRTASSTQKAYLKLARRTVAMNGTGKVLDYRKAIKGFKTSGGNHTTWRRNFAAGWMGYHSIKHITKGERAKVAKIARKYNTDRHPNRTPLSGCKGASKLVTKQYEKWNYWNSCQTNAWIRQTDLQLSIGCGLVAAIIGFVVAGVSGPLGGLAGALFAATCLQLKHARIEPVRRAQDASSKNAVIIKTRTPEWYTGYYSVQSQ